MTPEVSTPWHDAPMALLKIDNRQTRVIAEFVVFAVVMFSVSMLVSDTSATSALITSVISGVLFVVLFEWLNRRLRS